MLLYSVDHPATWGTKSNVWSGQPDMYCTVVLYSRAVLHSPTVQYKVGNDALTPVRGFEGSGADA
jgi:hypothetical protein